MCSATSGTCQARLRSQGNRIGQKAHRSTYIPEGLGLTEPRPSRGLAAAESGKVGESILMVLELEKARWACLGSSVIDQGAEVFATGP